MKEIIFLTGCYSNASDLCFHRNKAFIVATIVVAVCDDIHAVTIVTNILQYCRSSEL